MLSPLSLFLQSLARFLVPFIIQWVDNVSGAEELISFNTPVGRLLLSIRQDVITKADWVQEHGEEPSCDHQIKRYLAQYWTNPDIAIPVSLLRQGSAYRHTVWNALCQIPVGETVSYSVLAQKITSAARAVGNACRDNPYPLFIPCHRVVSASGIGGYCGQTEGYFMQVKHQLLAFEAAFKK